MTGYVEFRPDTSIVLNETFGPAVDVVEGDTWSRSLGVRDADNFDGSDSCSINTVDGRTYTFALTFPAGAPDNFRFDTSLPDETLVETTLIDGATSLTLGFTALATGTGSLNVQGSEFAGADYLVTLSDIAIAPASPTIGDDTLLGTVGNDVIGGLGGHDEIYGGDGKDSLSGGAGDDLLFGGLMNDSIDGGAGNDVLIGGKSDDRLFGGDGADDLFGGAHDDRLYGGADNDVLNGDHGNDILSGDDGDDILNGGRGDDVLIGGTGADTFVFTEIVGNDRIRDFEVGIDKIDIAGYGPVSDAYAIELASQVGSDVVLDFGQFGAVTLEGINLGDLTSTDFIYLPDEIFAVG